MLKTRFLFDPAGEDLVLTPGFSQSWIRSALGVALVMPRGQCVYARLSAQGVPLLRLRDFARLQLGTLSPFQVPDYYVIRVGTVLHAWMWDAKHALDFSRRHNFGDDVAIHVVPSSVCVPKPAKTTSSAIFLQRAFEPGIEAQLWSGDTLQHSGWFEAMPAAPEWQSWRADVNHRELVEWPDALPEVVTLTRPAPAFKAGFLTRRRRATLSLTRLWPVTLSLATVALVGYGAWLLGRIDQQHRAIVQLNESQSLASANSEPLLEARQQTLALQYEIKGMSHLIPKPTGSTVLRAVTDVMYSQGLVIREFEFDGATVRVTVLAGQGDLKMSRLIEAVEANPLFEGARFIDSSPQGGVRFSWNIRMKTA